MHRALFEGAENDDVVALEAALASGADPTRCIVYHGQMVSALTVAAGVGATHAAAHLLKLEAVRSLRSPEGIYTPLMPKASTTQKTIEQTMVQGGTFVFDGTKELFAHYDFSSGDHADLDEVVRIATGRS